MSLRVAEEACKASPPHSGPRRALWHTAPDCGCTYACEEVMLRPRPVASGMADLADRVLPLRGVGTEALPDSRHMAFYLGAGSAIGWHADDEPIFGPSDEPRAIVSLSLGATRTFRFRRRGGSKRKAQEVELPARGLCTMEGMFRSVVLHSVARAREWRCGPRACLT